MRIACINCGDNVDAELVTGDIVYPHRKDLKHLYFYKCPICGNFVGCHKGTKKPLGVIPTPELKKARIQVHNKLDPLWKSGKHSRKFIYKILSKHLGWEYHTGMTTSVSECEHIIRFLERKFGGIKCAD